MSDPIVISDSEEDEPAALSLPMKDLFVYDGSSWRPDVELRRSVVFFSQEGFRLTRKSDVRAPGILLVFDRMVSLLQPVDPTRMYLIVLIHGKSKTFDEKQANFAVLMERRQRGEFLFPNVGIMELEVQSNDALRFANEPDGQEKLLELFRCRPGLLPVSFQTAPDCSQTFKDDTEELLMNLGIQNLVETEQTHIVVLITPDTDGFEWLDISPCGTRLLICVQGEITPWNYARIYRAARNVMDPEYEVPDDDVPFDFTREACMDIIGGIRVLKYTNGVLTGLNSGDIVRFIDYSLTGGEACVDPYEGAEALPLEPFVASMAQASVTSLSPVVSLPPVTVAPSVTSVPPVTVTPPVVIKYNVRLYAEDIILSDRKRIKDYLCNAHKDTAYYFEERSPQTHCLILFTTKKPALEQIKRMPDVTSGVVYTYLLWKPDHEYDSKVWQQYTKACEMKYSTNFYDIGNNAIVYGITDTNAIRIGSGTLSDLKTFAITVAKPLTAAPPKPSLSLKKSKPASTRPKLYLDLSNLEEVQRTRIIALMKAHEIPFSTNPASEMTHCIIVAKGFETGKEALLPAVETDVLYSFLPITSNPKYEGSRITACKTKYGAQFVPLNARIVIPAGTRNVAFTENTKDSILRFLKGTSQAPSTSGAKPSTQPPSTNVAADNASAIPSALKPSTISSGPVYLHLNNVGAWMRDDIRSLFRTKFVLSDNESTVHHVIVCGINESDPCDLPSKQTGILYAYVRWVGSLFFIPANRPLNRVFSDKYGYAFFAVDTAIIPGKNGGARFSSVETPQTMEKFLKMSPVDESEAPFIFLKCIATKCPNNVTSPPYCADDLDERLDLEIIESTIPHAGKGLFATADLKKSEGIIAFYGGRRITKAQKEAHDVIPGRNDYVIKIGNLDFYLDAFEVRRRFPASMVNDGTDRNKNNAELVAHELQEEVTGIPYAIDKDGRKWTVGLRLLRDIKSGEEILASYGSAYWGKSDKRQREEQAGAQTPPTAKRGKLDDNMTFARHTSEPVASDFVSHTSPLNEFLALSLQSSAPSETAQDKQPLSENAQGKQPAKKKRAVLTTTASTGQVPEFSSTSVLSAFASEETVDLSVDSTLLKTAIHLSKKSNSTATNVKDILKQSIVVAYPQTARTENHPFQKIATAMGVERIISWQRTSSEILYSAVFYPITRKSDQLDIFKDIEMQNEDEPSIYEHTLLLTDEEKRDIDMLNQQSLHVVLILIEVPDLDDIECNGDHGTNKECTHVTNFMYDTNTDELDSLVDDLKHFIYNTRTKDILLFSPLMTSDGETSFMTPDYAWMLENENGAAFMKHVQEVQNYSIRLDNLRSLIAFKTEWPLDVQVNNPKSELAIELKDKKKERNAKNKLRNSKAETLNEKRTEAMQKLATNIKKDSAEAIATRVMRYVHPALLYTDKEVVKQKKMFKELIKLYNKDPQNSDFSCIQKMDNFIDRFKYDSAFSRNIVSQLPTGDTKTPIAEQAEIWAATKLKDPVYAWLFQDEEGSVESMDSDED